MVFVVVVVIVVAAVVVEVDVVEVDVVGACVVTGVHENLDIPVSQTICCDMLNVPFETQPPLI